MSQTPYTNTNHPKIETGWKSGHQWKLWLAGMVGSRYDGLTHFSVVDPGMLMRSGQPRVSDLDQIRREHGLGAVACVRGGTRHPLRGRWFRKERAYCSKHGLYLFQMKMSDQAPPESSVFERFLDVVRKPENQPVLVHCEQGFHRTGIMVAAYRIAFNQWQLSDAIEEMARYGFEADEPKRKPLADELIRWAKAMHPNLTDGY